MLHNVFYAIIDSKFAYGISSWYSFLVKSQIMQINSFFKRPFKYGYVKSIITVEQRLGNYDDHLFYRASCGNHCRQWYSGTMVQIVQLIAVAENHPWAAITGGTGGRVPPII